MIPAMTSPAPAIGGIAAGDTNDTASMRRRPVALSASISRMRSATGTVASFCRPSRGPTSPISTASGHLDIRRRLPVAPVAPLRDAEAAAADADRCTDRSVPGHDDVPPARRRVGVNAHLPPAEDLL